VDFALWNAVLIAGICLSIRAAQSARLFRRIVVSAPRVFCSLASTIVSLMAFLPCGYCLYSSRACSPVLILRVLTTLKSLSSRRCFAAWSPPTASTRLSRRLAFETFRLLRDPSSCSRPSLIIPPALRQSSQFPIPAGQPLLDLFPDLERC